MGPLCFIARTSVNVAHLPIVTVTAAATVLGGVLEVASVSVTLLGSVLEVATIVTELVTPVVMVAVVALSSALELSCTLTTFTLKGFCYNRITVYSDTSTVHCCHLNGVGSGWHQT